MGDVGSASKSVPKGAGEEDGKQGKQPVKEPEIPGKLSGIAAFSFP
jgi:hypothetical protein